jgi:gluconate 5-dehydrogenase
MIEKGIGMKEGLQMFDLSGQWALVTGSSRGLGFAIARGLARVGASVVIHGSRRETAEKAASALTAEGLTTAVTAFDVRDVDQVAAAIEKLRGEGIAPGIIVNNAGINRRHPLAEFPYEDWKAVLETHLDGSYAVAKAAIGPMIEKRKGKIINICSLASEVARPRISAYATAKGGLKMLTKAMAVEWAQHGICANGIAPGYFLTEMNTELKANKEFDDWVCKSTPAGRWANPDELVGAAVFLSSSASDYVNGHMLAVDGGFLASM